MQTISKNKKHTPTTNNMKRLITAIMATLLTTTAFAQINTGEFSVSENSVYYGVRMGINISSLSGNKETLSTKTGFNIGGVIGLRLSDTTPIFLESGLYYTQRGAKSGKAEVNLNYLEVPVLIKAGFNVTDDIAVLPFIGPYFSLGVSGKKKGYETEISVNPDGTPYIDINHFYSISSYGRETRSLFSADNRGYNSYSRSDLGIKFGCGAEWNILYIEIGAQLGIINVLDDEEFSQRGNALFMNFGVNF